MLRAPRKQNHPPELTKEQANFFLELYERLRFEYEALIDYPAETLDDVKAYNSACIMVDMLKEKKII